MSSIVYRRLLAFFAGALAASSALAADPSDNQALADQIPFLTGSLDTAVVAGLAPFDLVSRPGEAIEFGVNLGLKAIPPAFVERPTREVPDGSSRYREFSPPQVQGEYENWFGFWDITPLPTDWGDLGAPYVWHSNTGVKVTALIPDDTLPDDDSDPNDGKTVRLAEGVHEVYWQARSQLSPFWDVALPGVLMAWNFSSEGRYGSAAAEKAAHATPTAARRLKKALVKTAQEIAKTAGLQAAAYLSNGLLDDSQPTVANSARQQLTVWDTHTPELSTSAPSITLEAVNFGGLWYTNAHPKLLDTLTYSDPCGRTVSLSNDAPSFLGVDTTTPITWTARDAGPYPPGIADHASITQQVTVLDTQPPLLVPPAGFARESSTPIDLTSGAFSLGKALMVDLADPAPTLTNDAPDTLDVNHRYVVHYTATDASGNSTMPPATDPEAYSQVVTIKAPGTNTAPTAAPASGRRSPRKRSRSR